MHFIKLIKFDLYYITYKLYILLTKCRRAAELCKNVDRSIALCSSQNYEMKYNDWIPCLQEGCPFNETYAKVY